MSTASCSKCLYFVISELVCAYTFNIPLSAANTQQKPQFIESEIVAVLVSEVPCLRPSGFGSPDHLRVDNRDNINM